MNRAEFDQFADEYEAQHRANIAITGEAPDYFARYKIEELKRIASEAQVAVRDIIDFGSGIGNSIPHFRTAFPHAVLSCADVSPRSLELGSARFPGPETLVRIDEATIPVHDQSFDAAFSACVFHHIPHEEHVPWLKELYRVTRSRGIVVIFEHNPGNPLTRRAVNTCPFDVNARLIWASQLAQRFRMAGWQDVSVEYHVFFPRALAPLRALEPRLRWLPVGAQYCAIARKR